MASIIRCDRCSAENCQIIKVLGKDLCNTCVAAFSLWVESGVEKPVERFSSQRGWKRKIDAVLREHGEVDPVLLAKLTGISERTADDALRYHKSTGMLDRVGPRRYKRAAEVSP